MHAIRRAALSLLCLLPACAGPGAAPAAVARHDARAFYATTSFSGGSFSHDGTRLLVTSDASGTFNACALDLATRQLAPLTASTTDATFGVAWFPHDERCLLTADRGGDERNHLFVREPDGTLRDLTPGADVKASFLGWAADERSFFARTNERDARFFDLYRYRHGPGVLEAGAAEVAPGYARELLFQNPGGYDLAGVSRDGAWVALVRTNDNADSDVFVARTREPGTLVHATPHAGKVQSRFASFSPDGRTLYTTSDERGEFASVWSFDLASHERAPVLADDWDVTDYSFSEDGRWLATAVNADARTRVRVFEVASGREAPLPDLPEGDVTGVVFERGGARLACTVSGDRSPANLWLVDLASGASRRLTDALAPEIREDELVEAESVRFPGEDGLAIPALLYRPHGASRARPAPALLWMHGEPGGQSRHGYNPTIQHLVNHGYAVLAVNNRGSSGYGKTFFHLDDRRHGEADLDDCVAARRWLETLPWVDGARVGIAGGSYGGYLVCAALAFRPQAFDVGIDLFGVTNWIRTLESVPAWWADFRASLYAEIGDPAADRERLLERSPLAHADEIRRPLLVVQGANDPRVLQAESEEIVAAVRANGVPVEYVLFPDEGHGFRSKQNRIRASEAYLAFLERYLRGIPGG